VLLVKSFGLIQRNMDVEWVSLPLSVSLTYIPIPIAGFAIVLQALAQVAEAIGGAPLRDTSHELPL
jgi:TRAP-type transport system small permease protein